jgi:hypothetical protein
VSSNIAFGTAGYRSDCRNIAFKEVIAVNHASNERVWFKQVTPKSIKLSATDYNVPGSTFGLWSGFGIASNVYQYQLNICDSSHYQGLMISGYTSNCYKDCNSWCSDGSSPYFRMATGSDSNLSGVAWNEDGHRPTSKKLVSFGVRG